MMNSVGLALLTASRKSFSVTVFRRARMAYMPASVHTLLMSAPVELGHSLHTVAVSGCPKQCIGAHAVVCMQAPSRWQHVCNCKRTSHSMHSTSLAQEQHLRRSSCFCAIGVMALQTLWHALCAERQEAQACLPGEELKADVALAVHGARVDLEDLRARLQIGQAKLHLPI